MAIKKRYTHLNLTGSNHSQLDAELAYVTGTLDVGGAAKFMLGLSGSLTNLTDGSSYLVAGPNITITSASNGQITIEAASSVSIPQYWSSAVNNVIYTTASMAEMSHISASNGVEVTGSLTVEGSTNFGVPNNNTVTNSSFANGNALTATGYYSHAEGVGSSATNDAAHAEGYSTTASGYAAHAEGLTTTASGRYSHAEGWGAQSQGAYSHAEGSGSIAVGEAAHAEGWLTTAYGSGSLSAGLGTIANGQTDGGTPTSTQAAFGKYNISDASSLFVVGDGTSNANRHDVLRVTSGSVQVTGSLRASEGLSGSLTQLVDGTSYLVAGPNITITSASNGQVTIEAASGGGSSPQYWFSTGTSEVYTTGSVLIKAGLSATPAQNLIKFDISGSGYQSAAVNQYGAESGAYIAVDDVAVAAPGWNAYSGSITIAAATVLASGSGGAITISAGNSGYESGSIAAFPGGGVFLTAGAGGEAAANDTLVAGGSGGGLNMNAGQGGAGYAATGPGGGLSLNAGNAGNISLANTSDLANGGAGGNVTIYAGQGGNSQNGGTPGIGGKVTINAGTGGYNNDTAEYYNSGDVEILGANIPEISGSTIGSTLALGREPAYGSTNGFRVVTVNKEPLNIITNNGDTFLYVSGGIGQKNGAVPAISVFGGDLHVSGGLTVEYPSKFFGGLSGSLTQLTDGSSYLVAGPNVTITTASNGQVTIEAAAGGGSGPQYWSETSLNVIQTTGSVDIVGQGSAVGTIRQGGRNMLRVGGLDITPITGTAVTGDPGYFGYSESVVVSGSILSASYGIWNPLADDHHLLQHHVSIVAGGYTNLGATNYFTANYAVTSKIEYGTGVQTVIAATEITRDAIGSYAQNWDVNFNDNCEVTVTGSLGPSGVTVKWHVQRTKEMSIGLGYGIIT